MPTLSDIQNDPKFQALTQGAKDTVFDRLSQQDKEFQKLSPGAQAIVRRKITGNASANAYSENAGTARKPDPVMPYVADQFKKGLMSLSPSPGLGLEVMELPGQIVQHFTGLPIRVKTPYLSTREMNRRSRELLDIRNVPPPKDDQGKPNLTAKYLGAIANFAGAGAIPGLGVIGAAERPLLAAIVEGISTASSGASSVEGGELGRDLAHHYGVSPERGKKIGEFLGSILGPGIPSHISDIFQRGTRTAGKILRKDLGFTGFGKSSQVEAGKALAQEQISKSMEAHSEAAENLQESQALSEKVPGFSPTLGEATGAPGIVAIQHNISTQGPEQLAQAAERARQNQQAIGNFKLRAFPGSSSGFVGPVGERYRALQSDLGKRLDTVTSNIVSLANRYQFQDNAAIGERLRNLRDQQQEIARQIKNRKYDAVYQAANAAGIREDMSNVYSTVSNIVKSDPATFEKNMPPVFSEILSNYHPKTQQSKILLPSGENAPSMTKPTEVSFEELHSLSRRLNAEMSEAKVSGNSSEAYYLGKVMPLLRQKIDKYEGPEYGDVATKLRDANQFYVNKYKNVFQEGAGARMARINRFGDVTPDENIVRQLIFKPGGAKGVDDYFNIFGDDPHAYEQLKNGVLDVFSKDVVRDGEIKPALVESFERRYAQSLDRLPRIKQELSNIDRANDALMARRQVIQQQQRLLDKTAVARIANTDDADAVLNKALSDRKTMTGLVSQAAKDPQASQALARAVADKVSEHPEPLKFLTENEEALKPAMDRLGAGHWDNLMTIAKAMGITSRVKVPTSVNLESLQDIGTKWLGTPIKSIFQQFRAINQGRAGKPYVLFDLLGKYIFKVKTAEANRMLQTAIYDPEVARQLAEMAKTGTISQKGFNRLRAHYWSHYIRLLSVASEPSDRDARQGSSQASTFSINRGSPTRPNFQK